MGVFNAYELKFLISYSHIAPGIAAGGGVGDLAPVFAREIARVRLAVSGVDGPAAARLTGVPVVFQVAVISGAGDSTALEVHPMMIRGQLPTACGLLHDHGRFTGVGDCDQLGLDGLVGGILNGAGIYTGHDL